VINQAEGFSSKKRVPVLSGHGRVKIIKRGHLQTYIHNKREPRFFAIEIEKHFEFNPDWYRSEEAYDLVQEYYVHLRSVLRTQTNLRDCLKHCKHCGIFFITHPRNQKRKDLRCPFGCMQSHRALEAKRRSTEYYRTKQGKYKKQLLNRARYLIAKAKKPEASGKQEKGETGKEKPIVEYVQMLTSLIEGREVSMEEIKRMLRKKGRQRSIGRKREVDYIVEKLNKAPPRDRGKYE